MNIWLTTHGEPVLRIENEGVVWAALQDGITFVRWPLGKSASKLDLARAFLREVEARHPERKIKRVDSNETHGGTD